MTAQTTGKNNIKPVLPKGEADSINNDISPLEKELLDTAGQDDEERKLHEDEVDNTDEDGDLLNENTSNDASSGSELDVPGSEADDADEEIGEEDEENNSYSVADN